MTGSLLLFISSTFWLVMPFSSASMRPYTIHLTIENQSSSPRRTTGPRGSLEMVSGRMT